MVMIADIIILVSILYITPALISYFGVRHQYKNEWFGLKPDLGAFAMVFVPFLNLGYAVFTIIRIVFKNIDRFLNKVEYSKLNTKIKKSEFGRKFFKI